MEFPLVMLLMFNMKNGNFLEANKLARNPIKINLEDDESKRYENIAQPLKKKSQI